MNRQGPDEGRYPIQDTLVALGVEMAGQNARGWRAACFLHDDTMPSMWVYADTNSFYCYGCGAWGGPVAAVQKSLVCGGRTSRKAALAWLGAHVPAVRAPPRLDHLVNTKIQGSGGPSDLTFALDRLLQCGMYHHGDGNCVAAAAIARDYLFQRGFTEAAMDVIWDMDLPCIVGGFPKRTFRLRADKGAYKALATLGLTNARGWLQKRFCPGVFFGIRDLRGMIVGMQARSLRKPPEPKYLFTRSHQGWARTRSLYLFAESLTAWGTMRPLTLVEGPLDALAVATAEAPVAALMGDTLCTGQIDLLHAAGVHKIRLWLDFDAAGRQAKNGIHESLTKRGYLVTCVVDQSPPLKDAADVLQAHGVAGVGHVLASAE